MRYQISVTLRVFIFGLCLLALVACRRPETTSPTSAPTLPPYVERLTGASVSNEALPLIVAIHGYGDRPEDFSALATGFPVKARWIFLRGFLPMGQGHAWFPIRFRDGRAEALAVELASASEKVNAIIQALRSEKPTRGPVIVTGFSQGGMLSYALAVQSAPVVDFAFPVGGWLPDSMVPSDRRVTLPIVAFHGAEDRIVPFEATKSMAERLAQSADHFEFLPFEGVGHTISAEMRAALFAAIERALTERSFDASK